MIYLCSIIYYISTAKQNQIRKIYLNFVRKLLLQQFYCATQKCCNLQVTYGTFWLEIPFSERIEKISTLFSLSFFVINGRFSWIFTSNHCNFDTFPINLDHFGPTKLSLPLKKLKRQQIHALFCQKSRKYFFFFFSHLGMWWKSST